MATLDMANAYFSISLVPEHRRFLAFKWRDRLYECQCLILGLSQAPRVYTKCMKLVASYLRRLGLRLIVYLDDWIFLNSSCDSLLTDIALACDTLEWLDVTVNYAKSSLTPSQSVLYLGLIVDSMWMSLLVLDDKLVRIKHQCTKFLRLVTIPMLRIMEFLSRLTSVSLAVFPSTLYSRNLQRLLIDHVRSMGGYNGSLMLPDVARADLSC